MDSIGVLENSALERSKDYANTPQVRSALRHSLMDKAQRSGDLVLRRKIGRALIDAYNNNDLTAQVSDHFVRDCPNEVFREFGLSGPNNKYWAWKKRATRAPRQE